MGYVMLQLAVSLDMYIARKDGSVDFLDDIGDEFNDSFKSFQESIDTIIMGRSTYDMMKSFGPIPFTDKKIVVLTNRVFVDEPSHVSFSNNDIPRIVKEHSGNIWLFGGANVIKQFIDQDLIDEMQIFVVPTVLGEGIPLFEDSNGYKKLQLHDIKQFGDNVLLTYRRIKKWR